MTTNRTSTPVVALAALLLSSAAARAQDVKTDYDHAADFGKIKTFSLKIGTAWGNPLGEKRVTDEITTALTEKGWKPAPEGSADALVVLHGASSTKKNLTTFYDGWGGYRWGG